MAYFIFTGADNSDLDPDQVQNNTDMDFLGNWSNSDESGADDGQADRLPTIGDTSFIFNTVGEGSLVSDHVLIALNFIGTGVYNGNFTCIDFVDNYGITFASVTIIGDFTCFGPDSLQGCTITGTTNAANCQVGGGDFNGDLIVSQGGNVVSPTVTGDLNMDENVSARELDPTQLKRVSFDGGNSWFTNAASTGGGSTGGGSPAIGM